MRQLLSTFRHRPAPLLGAFVALFAAATIITVTASIIGTGLTYEPPAQALAATSLDVVGTPTVAVTSGSGEGATTDVVPLPSYRRVPAALAHRLAGVPGVEVSLPDVSIPVALVLPGGRVVAGSPAHPLTGHGWQDARLAPFTLRRGHRPTGPAQVVVGAALAERDGLRIGEQVRLVGEDLSPFKIVGLAGTARGDPADEFTLFFSDAEATSLYGHPGQVDLVGVISRPGVSPAVLAGRVRSLVASSHVTVLTGHRRGEAEDLTAATDKSNLLQLALSAGIDVTLISFFVVASTVGLAVYQRRRSFALLRAVGATPGQVRRQVLAELGVLGALAGILGVLPGSALASLALRGLAAHQLMPPSARAWTSGWLLLIAAGTGAIVAELSGVVAAWRASRIDPTRALSESDVERRFPHPARAVLGVVCLAGGVVLCAVTIRLPFSDAEELNLALGMGLAFLAAIALLGPLLVAAMELVARLPVLVLARAPGRLALGELRTRPRRVATAVTTIALATAFVGTIYVDGTTEAHAAGAESARRVSAEAVVTAEGTGLGPRVLSAISHAPGVQGVVGLTSTTVLLPNPGTEATAAEAVTSGPLTRLLELHVVAGNLERFRPGDIALSQLVAGTGAVGAHVGQRVTTYLADGTRYRATVSAIYTRSLGFADAILPSGAGGGGHFGTSALDEVLVDASPAVSTSSLVAELSALDQRYPGLRVVGRRVANANDELLDSQTSYENELVLVLVGLLSSIALVNTLVMATVERRDGLRLLRRVGATRGQLTASAVHETVLVAGIGLLLGTCTAGTAVVIVSRALTGSWTPYVTWEPVAVIAGLVVLLTSLSVLLPTRWATRAEDER